MTYQDGTTQAQVNDYVAGNGVVGQIVQLLDDGAHVGYVVLPFATLAQRTAAEIDHDIAANAAVLVMVVPCSSLHLIYRGT